MEIRIINIDDNDAVIIGFIILVVMLVFRNRFAREIVEGQNKFWGFKFGEKTVKLNEILIPIMALLFFIFTLLVKSGVVK